MTIQDPTAQPTQPDEGPEGFREAKKVVESELRDEQAKNALLQAENVAFKVQAAGLDPNVGIGKSIVKDIKHGEYVGEITPSALAAYAASEYGESVDPTADPAPVTPEQNPLSEAQAQGDQIQTVASSTPVPAPVSTDALIGEAQREMLRPDATPDEVERAAKSSISLKVNQLQDDWKAGRIRTTPEP